MAIVMEQPTPLAASASPPDRDLLARMRTGEPEAFGTLYRRHEPDARRYARRLAPRHADDVVADAFASTLSAIHGGRGPSGDFRPYLFTAIRRHAMRTWNRTEADGCEREVADHVDVDRGLELAESPVLDAFATLPERWRRVLFLVDVEGIPVQEAAATLGLSPNATSALAYRARAGLRAAFLRTAGAHAS
ncbi:MAG: polymerase sigma factor, sigma-70 family [Acidimicrobiales bacterium]|nr:polymerase sigma factor, sigma-70 family [Acidimicrobiales bacterium]